MELKNYIKQEQKDEDLSNTETEAESNRCQAKCGGDRFSGVSEDNFTFSERAI